MMRPCSAGREIVPNNDQKVSPNLVPRQNRLQLLPPNSFGHFELRKVERRRLELPTSALRTQRSPN